MSVLRPSAPPPGRAHSVASLVRPRSATFVELYYIFISLWGHQLYTPYGILYVSFIILLVVTACVTVSVTYLQLSMENHHWWWQAVRSGGYVRARRCGRGHRMGHPPSRCRSVPHHFARVV